MTMFFNFRLKKSTLVYTLPPTFSQKKNLTNSNQILRNAARKIQSILCDFRSSKKFKMAVRPACFLIGCHLKSLLLRNHIFNGTAIW